MARAQGNLMDLYSWIDESTPFRGLINIDSSNSASFIGDYGDNFSSLNHLNLTANLDTTPGVTYEISFTLQDASLGNFGGAGDLWFGNSEINLNSAFQDGYITPNGYVFPAVNYSFTAAATSSTTAMSFDFVLDEGLNADLSNLAITQITDVPEVSTFSMFFYGGFVFLLAKQLRKVTQKRKLAFNR
jgi:hypothetical protein